MKKFLLVVALIMGIVGFTGSGWAYYLADGTDIGILDTIAGSGNLADSGLETEATFINGFIDPDVTKDDITQISTPEGAGWMPVYNDNAGKDLAAGVWAFDFDFAGTPNASPDWFAVKTGAKKDEIDHFFANNNELKQYAVISLASIEADNVGKISHLTVGEGTSVPEPASLILLGLGLVGIGAAVRRRVQK